VANAHSLPFLATTGHHGSIITIGALDYGVDINLRELKSVAVEPNGKIANIQGGVLAKDVTDALWDVGKWSGKKKK
jgi:FAD/FMN-containing dehydrogenase